MKTIADLKALLPSLLQLFSEADCEIGDREYEHNCFYYEEDGWEIEVHYECCGEYLEDSGDYWNPPCYDLLRGWGEVTEITAYHYDDETGDEVEFSSNELAELFAPFNDILKNIA